MKKIFIIFMLFAAYIGAKDVQAYTQREFLIDWYCINVDIPLGASFANYQDNYIVNVYVDGIKLSEKEYYCVVGVNGTSTTTVNTNKVGEYRIGVRVELYNYNASSENYITYKVVDTTAPELTVTTDTISTRYGVTPDYSVFYTAFDNSSDDLKITVDDKDVVYKTVGEYTVFIKATDSSNNSYEIEITVFVVDNLKPVIQLIKPVEISLGTEIDVEEFFTGVDGYDGTITNRIVIENYDKDKLGEQLVYASLKDLAGNEARVQITVSVIDDIAPTISFNTNDAKIDIDQDITYDIFVSYIKEVSDDSTLMDIYDVRIDFSNVLNELGSYDVYYYISDAQGNECEAKLTVRVVQFSGPTITCREIYIGYGETFSESLISNYIEVYDKYDSSAANTLRIDLTGVNLAQPGIYFALVSACNSSGVFTYETLKITVEGSSFFNLEKYWPLTLIALGPIGYFGYMKFKQSKEKKYEEDI